MALLLQSTQLHSQDVSPQPLANQAAKPELFEQQKSELMAEIQKLAEQFQSAQQSGKFDEALQLLDRVYANEVRIFGPVHAELLGTLDWQARVSQAAKQFELSIGFRQKAFEIGVQLYPEGSYQLGDLKRTLADAKQYALLTPEQQQSLGSMAVKLNRR